MRRLALLAVIADRGAEGHRRQWLERSLNNRLLFRLFMVGRFPMRSIRSTVKRFVPRPILAAYGRGRLRWDMATSRGKSREEIFSDIYENNRWGGEPGSYDLGSGSRPDVTGPYISALRALIRKEGVKYIVDLGCGDFEVAPPYPLAGAQLRRVRHRARSSGSQRHAILGPNTSNFAIWTS